MQMSLGYIARTCECCLPPSVFSSDVMRLAVCPGISQCMLEYATVPGHPERTMNASYAFLYNWYIVIMYCPARLQCQTSPNGQ